ncbi:MAG: HDIG domain-containing protein [Deferribacteraceae bacterium]|jgi:putative nucleotidyltransferase with HDIG domain|nr:HDIG domain-containing protein [Deferribacteraceae bacterium]
MNRDNALELVKKYNNDESHIRHALAVEATMRYFANKYGGDADVWGVVGLLHDIDWEMTMAEPAKHCNVAPAILRENGVSEEYIRAVQAHGYGICTDVKPESMMERVLFTIDELTGLIITAGLVRPSKSLQDLELKSVKKKWKDKAFARGVNREIIEMGATMMESTIDEVIEGTIMALRPVEKEIGF